ncbi:MAG: hypothetical protein V4858_26435 [Pseudomonadota bacterium]
MTLINKSKLSRPSALQIGMPVPFASVLAAKSGFPVQAWPPAIKKTKK